ncbi:DUF4376 domain-containing protein [Microvirga solisilvae]|uniref:DUF4376 domain-containing protein n=1 Tax=Microvirga solisilvae TaxID=2919498 RepID=UPI001FAF57E0|nr:DUF4376 domain-containing protein [Microvirga solisilvae]
MPYVERDAGGNIVGTFANPQPGRAEEWVDAVDIPLDLPAYAAQRRWEIETSGITVSVAGEPIPVSTMRGDDRDALQSTYTAIKDGLRQDGATFKFADGKPRRMSNADMLTVILAALTHVQACFNMEGDLLTNIEGGSIATDAQIDAEFATIPISY